MEPHLPLSVLIQPHPFPTPKQQLSREWGVIVPIFSFRVWLQMIFFSTHCIICFCMWLSMQNKWSHPVHLLPRFACPFVTIRPCWHDPLLSSSFPTHQSVYGKHHNRSHPFFCRGAFEGLPLFCSYKQSFLYMSVSSFYLHRQYIMIVTPFSVRFWKLKLLAKVTCAKRMTWSLLSARPHSQLFQINLLPKLKQFPTYWL